MSILEIKYHTFSLIFVLFILPETHCGLVFYSQLKITTKGTPFCFFKDVSTLTPSDVTAVPVRERLPLSIMTETVTASV